jgi:Transmembrane secretion effector
VSRGQLFRPLAVRDFRLLWGGQTVSLLGDGIFVIALAWQTIKLSSNPATLSIVLLARAGPEVLLALVGGAVSDRLPRRTVLLASDVVGAASIGTLAVLSASGRIEVWHLVSLSLIYGVTQAFFEPALYAIYPEILSPEVLLQATALRSTGAILAIELVGPALGGVIVAVAGTATAFAVDVATFGVSLATLLPLSIRQAPHHEVERSSIASDVRDAFRFVRSQRWLWITMVITSASNFFLAGTLRVAIPVLVKERLHRGAGALGVVTGALGVGGLLAIAVVGRFGSGPHRTLRMYLAWIGAGLAMAAAGVFAVLGAVTAFVGAIGLGLAFGNTIWLTMVQEMVPTNVMGRVFSLDTVISQGLLPVSIAVSGPVVGWAGPGTALVLGGALSAGATAIALTRPGALDLDRPRPSKE